MDLSRRLHAYVQRHGARAFSWEHANCCHFAAGWVAEVTGRNPMAGLEATPTFASTRHLLRHLGGTLVEATTLRMGAPPMVPAMAQAGDVLHMALPGGACAIGICTGRDAWFVQAGGLVRLHTLYATHAWAVRA